ncbi:SDR family oxidoreductase [Nitratireductor sp. ZSWI3]|uniref:SDR family oxidoreductase n=1 Tax=Nitratireductor sp. ZSWI3 TaxID=2966359 RepID=UPI00214FC501|nr:SDR family oxidoreductase [Nitratireductor sp. ZSWI3]MCR4264707.1 SDR family oxidoreductase [Nitratireductor sp. ZSWI3]
MKGASMEEHPQQDYPAPPFARQQQERPGETAKMDPLPDHGEHSYRGSGRLRDRVALITGGDSGIGRAVAIAFAREGADVAISYLSENSDAKETARWVEDAGRKALLLRGDIAEEKHCKQLVQRTVQELGRLDILVNNAAYQASYETLEEITAVGWELTFRTNVHAMFYLCKEALRHMKPGSAIINTSSINASDPSPSLLAYATTKGAISNFTAGLAGLVAERGVRVNAVAPGPIWTPLIPSTMPAERVENFGANTPMKRPGQPAELAATFVLLASPESSYTTGAVIEVTGGRPML